MKFSLIAMIAAVSAIKVTKRKDYPEYVDEMHKATMASPSKDSQEIIKTLNYIEGENAWRGAPWYANDPNTIAPFKHATKPADKPAAKSAIQLTKVDESTTKKDYPEYVDEMGKATMAGPNKATEDFGKMLKSVKDDNAWRAVPWYDNDPNMKPVNGVSAV
jgi:hypothetical protein